jgi:hypothetical protein
MKKDRVDWHSVSNSSRQMGVLVGNNSLPPQLASTDLGRSLLRAEHGLAFTLRVT